MMRLFAGDEGDGGGALQLDDAVVVLARQQPEREADHARAVAEHALDSQIGLAGIGRTQDGGDPSGRGDGHDLKIGPDSSECKRHVGGAAHCNSAKQPHALKNHPLITMS